MYSAYMRVETADEDYIIHYVFFSVRYLAILSISLSVRHRPSILCDSRIYSILAFLCIYTRILYITVTIIIRPIYFSQTYRQYRPTLKWKVNSVLSHHFLLRMSFYFGHKSYFLFTSTYKCIRLYICILHVYICVHIFTKTSMHLYRCFCPETSAHKICCY